MTDALAKAATPTDYSATLFLPKTDFPMRAGLPDKEPQILARWEEIDLYRRLRETAAGRPKFVLHDGPPYANGAIHIGHALNKILKDTVTRSQQMLGHDSNYVPGWDCHGLPIEWKIEEQYRAAGKNKDEVPVVEFRRECRAFAEHWLDEQRREFKRLGVTGDWEHPYSTMAFHAEAQIAREIMKFKDNGLLYRGSKPVMWSVVEKTALADAEVEYQDYTSDAVYVAFPVASLPLQFQTTGDASVVIWTTTPWTIPGNRAIAFSPKVSYGLYQVTDAPEGNWAKKGAHYILADKLAPEVFKAAKVLSYDRLLDVPASLLSGLLCAHPLADWRPSPLVGEGREGVAPSPALPPSKSRGPDFDTYGGPSREHPTWAGGESTSAYAFTVPLLPGDHVTDEAGTGFVHTAPGHGVEDFEVWMEHGRELQARGIDTRIPFTVDADGVLTDEAPGFTGTRVLTPNGDKGDANEAVIKALAASGHLVARGRLKHSYPHSWRSKKPVIYRNTPQWFIAMDLAFSLASTPSPALPHSNSGVPEFDTPDGPSREHATWAGGEGRSALPSPLVGEGKEGVGSNLPTLRDLAFEAIADTQWVPETGRNRIRGMVENKPDWVMSRQRAWGVPIAVFVDAAGAMLRDARVDALIANAFEAEGADAWFLPDAKARFLAPFGYDPALWEQVTDVLDVWFDSGSTHAYTLEDPVHFPGLAGIDRKVDGGRDEVMYLEGSDQHRGWFQSSLLESCGTRGRAPFDIVLTHGFVLDEKGQKMSKSLGNVVAPQTVMKTSGADILRLWVAQSDYSDDLRIGPEVLKGVGDAYRKLRNTLRWMLGTLAHMTFPNRFEVADLPELERLVLHRLSEIDGEVREAYAAFDYAKVVTLLSVFMNAELSAFYFDVRKDALYCDPPSSPVRRHALMVVDILFDHLTLWLAPILVFTSEEAWLSRHPESESVHLETFPDTPGVWRDDALAARWERIREVRRVVTGALEGERAAKRIGSSLEAAPEVFVEDASLAALLESVDFAEVCITSAATIRAGAGPAEAFRLPETRGVAVAPRLADGRKCARSWKITPDVGADPDFPDVTPRDAQALRELGMARAA